MTIKNNTILILTPKEKTKNLKIWILINLIIENKKIVLNKIKK